MSALLGTGCLGCCVKCWNTGVWFQGSLSLLTQSIKKQVLSQLHNALTKAKQQACQELEQEFTLGCAKSQVNLDF